jgi:signal transduction histidine kinase/CheY-like chemotaxis protein
MGNNDTGSTFQSSIRRITLLACLAGVALAGFGLGLIHLGMMYRAQIGEKRALAQVLAANASASLTFNDRWAAQEILGSLSAQPMIRSARLIRPDSVGSFAAYAAPAGDAGEGWAYARFTVSEPVHVGAQPPLGTLEIEVDLTPALTSMFWSYLGLLPLVLALSGGLAWWSGRRLQRRFVGPLFSLMDTASEVSTSNNYSLRAPDGNADEVGRLIETFNIMLGRIQVQSAQLRASEAELNLKVIDLQEEIELRHEAEQLRQQSDEERHVIERKMQEAQRLEGLGIMAGGIAHDFNNLLTAMLGHASLARMKISDVSPLVTHLAAIEVAARRATELCRQMLIYTGRRKPEYNLIDVAALLTEMISLLEVSVGTNCRLELMPSPEGLSINGDAAQVRQVLLNLVVNAADAIGSAQGRITAAVASVSLDDNALRDLRFSADAKPGEFVEIRVSDTGCGMTPEVLGRIFDPFFSTKFTGRGLGLAAVASIMRYHHGALDVKSTVGAGTVFHVYFPLNTERPVQRKAPDFAPRDSTPLHILLVDDEEAPRNAVASILAHHGHRVASFAVGIEALDQFGAENSGFDAAVLDYSMPGMNGGMLADALRMIRPNLPILIISGHINEAEMNMPPNVHFLRKPFTASELEQGLIEARRMPVS